MASLASLIESIFLVYFSLKNKNTALWNALGICVVFCLWEIFLVGEFPQPLCNSLLSFNVV